MKTDLEPWKTNLEPWKTIKTNLNHWKPIKIEIELWKTNLEPSKLTWSWTGWLWGAQVVTGDSQEEVLIFRDRQTDRQTHMHHNIYIINIIFNMINYPIMIISPSAWSTRLPARWLSSSPASPQCIIHHHLSTILFYEFDSDIISQVVCVPPKRPTHSDHSAGDDQPNLNLTNHFTN